MVHVEGRGRRPAWFTERVPVQPGLHSETLPWKTINQTRSFYQRKINNEIWNAHSCLMEGYVNDLSGFLVLFAFWDRSCFAAQTSLQLSVLGLTSARTTGVLSRPTPHWINDMCNPEVVSPLLLFIYPALLAEINYGCFFRSSLSIFFSS